MNPSKKWSKAEIKKNIYTSQTWLERGVLAIYNKQTDTEKNIQQTNVKNDVGFNGPDSRYLSFVANYLKKGNHLSGHHIHKTRKKMMKYCGQLEKIANKQI